MRAVFKGHIPMTARVLVVDDLLPNIKLLEARLSAEYFDVLSAMNGPMRLPHVWRGAAIWCFSM
jgi:CheY-like chemotaxis protein